MEIQFLIPVLFRKYRLKQTLQYGNNDVCPFNEPIAKGLKQTLQYGNLGLGQWIYTGLVGLKQTLQYGNSVDSNAWIWHWDV